MSKLFRDVQVLWISRFDYECDWYLKSHAHADFYQLMYMYQGSCEITVNNKLFTVEAPQVLFLPPGITHGITRILSSRLITLDVKFIVHDRPSIDMLKMIPFVQVSRNELPKQLLEQIRDEGQGRMRGYQDVCSALLSLLLLMMVRWQDGDDVQLYAAAGSSVTGRPKAMHPMTDAVIRFLREQSTPQVTAADFEHHLNHSYRYISDVFRRDMHKTPMMYLQQERIARARELLNYTEFEIKKIAQITGYTSVHQFSKIFRRLEGVPPGQYRDQRQHHIREDVCIHPEFVNELYVDSQ